MARRKVEKNIAYDDERKLYYVTLSYGKGADGKYKKSTVTAHTKSEAKTILKEHQRKKAAGTATPPAKDTLADVTKAYIDYKSLSLAVSTIYGYTNIWKNHIEPYFGKKKNSGRDSKGHSGLRLRQSAERVESKHSEKAY